MALTHYDVLGIARSASMDEVRRAYKHRALETHPDKLNLVGAEEKRAAESKFHWVREAFEVLIDEQKRRTYDADLRARAALRARPPASNAPSATATTSKKPRERDVSEARRKQPPAKQAAPPAAAAAADRLHQSRPKADGARPRTSSGSERVRAPHTDKPASPVSRRMAHRRSGMDPQEQREHLRMMSGLASMFDEMLAEKKLVFPLEPEWEGRLQRAYEIRRLRERASQKEVDSMMAAQTKRKRHASLPITELFQRSVKQ